tara:strand:- start:9418 stop:10896 length:1479 start_codon:yes stop_codon:yes gene_type:complete
MECLDKNLYFKNGKLRKQAKKIVVKEPEPEPEPISIVKEEDTPNISLTEKPYESTCEIYNADCLEKMKDIPDNSVDLIFCDLPYGQTSCKWDSLIDLEQFWIQVMRIKKLNTPIFMTTTTKFGVSLIQSAPKKCHFRYDLVWVKSAPAGFLCAKKMPMRKHEMVYVFYEKLPLYDLSSHQHKFLNKEKEMDKDKKTLYGSITDKGLPHTSTYDPPLPVSIVKEFKEDPNHKPDLYGVMGGNAGRNKGFHQKQYDPPLPVSIVKEGEMTSDFTPNKNGNIYDCPDNQEFKGRNGAPRYDPPLPVSVVKEEGCYGEKVPNSEAKYGQKCARQYDPPLPVSVVKEEITDDCYNMDERHKNGKMVDMRKTTGYDPPLPVSIVKEHKCLYTPSFEQKDNADNLYRKMGRKGGESAYDPPLPTTMLEIKSTRGKHSTEKPVQLMEWIFKYFSKEGDTILDPTMGSGSTGVACKNMNRNFIGIEMDKEIFEVAEKRLDL